MASPRALAMRQWRFTVGLLVAVIVSIFATGAIALGFVLWSAQGVDQRALDRQAVLAQHVIGTQLERIPHDQESVTLWDEAVLNTKLSLGSQLGRLSIWASGCGDYFGHDDVTRSRPAQPADLRHARRSTAPVWPKPAPPSHDVAPARRRAAAAHYEWRH